MIDKIAAIDRAIKKYLCLSTDIKLGWLEKMEIGTIGKKKVNANFCYSVFKLQESIKGYIDGFNKYNEAEGKTERLVFSREETEDEIVEQLKKVPFIDKVFAQNGFINIVLENKYLWEQVFA